ncbi:MAG TPA: hypothetical protein VGD74_11770 [Vulgatibacter sp.]
MRVELSARPDGGAFRMSGLRLQRRDRGAVNLVVLGMMSLVAIGAYFAYAWVPHWMRNRDVIQAMNEAGYQAWREDDSKLLEMILKRTDAIVLVEDEEGGERYPGIDESMIEIERDAKNVYIHVAYTVPMYLPWTKRVKEIRFDNRIRKDLEVPTR